MITHHEPGARPEPVLLAQGQADDNPWAGTTSPAPQAPAAGVDVQLRPARGHIHTSITAVDVLPSGAPVRAEMASALRRFFGASVPA